MCLAMPMHPPPQIAALYDASFGRCGVPKHMDIDYYELEETDKKRKGDWGQPKEIGKFTLFVDEEHEFDGEIRSPAYYIVNGNIRVALARFDQHFDGQTGRRAMARMLLNKEEQHVAPGALAGTPKAIGKKGNIVLTKRTATVETCRRTFEANEAE